MCAEINAEGNGVIGGVNVSGSELDATDRPERHCSAIERT